MQELRLDQPTARRSLVWTAFLIVALAGAAAADEYHRAPEPQHEKLTRDLVGLHSDPLRSETDGEEPWPACMANEFSVPGQGVHVSGSVGGLVRGRDADDIALGLMDPDSLAILERLARHATHDVAILVADAFGPANQRVFGVAQDVHDAPTDRGALEALVQQGKLSHGALVLGHLRALATDILGAPGSEAGVGDRLEWDLNGGRLFVRAVPLPNDAEGITNAIGTAIQEVADEHHVEGIVVNMSWVLLPCDVIEDFNAAMISDFGTYLERLEQVNGGQVTLRQLRNLVTHVDERSPLRVHLHSDEIHGVSTVAHVAAAGNFGLNFPMFPAAWEPVTAASAEAAFSNKGGVVERGGLFRFERRDWFYAGTSFTAPAVSLAAALDMSMQNPDCAWHASLPSPFDGSSGKRLAEAWC